MVVWLGAPDARGLQDGLLELLDSTPMVDGAQVDRFADGEFAAAWQRAHGGTGSAEERGHLLAARAALQAVTWGEQPSTTLEAHLDGVGLRPRITGSGSGSGSGGASGSGLAWELDAPTQRRLAVECVLAWGQMQEELPGRLRPCGNPSCRRFLIDRSKANNARWCSMARCGNRMKARRHYERSRTTSAP